ncbi:MAG TPA: cytochrome P450 [Allosphingosinicella sp.]|nr:cytochrome P450 [Allosphingosinicella sp.]
MDRNIKRDPLGWLDQAARDGRGVRWISRRELCIYDADVARALLRNDGGRMVEHSDFFGNGALAPARDVRVALARQAYALIHEHVQKLDCRRLVSTLDRRTEWPRAGGALLLDAMRPVLAAPWRSRAFHEALDAMVEARILGRHRPAVGIVRRIRDRFRFYRAVVGEAARSADAPTDERDLLEVVGSHRHEMDEAALAQLYAGFVFATVGSIGFALGWAVLQAVRQQKTEHHPTHIVLEALRLYPIAWLFQRRLRQPDVILGERILPTQIVTISPYAIHRNPVYWKEPTSFLPERWSTSADRSAWLPFGAGDHGCIAAGLSVGLASRLLSEILGRDPDIELGDGPPSIGAALAPPRFIVKLQASSL